MLSFSPVLFLTLLCRSLAEGRQLSGQDDTIQIKASNASQMNIAIIGGGASGLTLGYTLEQSLGHKVTVFESNSRVGGKVYSPIVQGETFDVGAVLIDSKFTDMMLQGKCAMPFNVTYAVSVWSTLEQGESPQNLDFLAGLEAYGFTDYMSEIPAWINVYNRYKYLNEDPMVFFEYEKNMPLYVPFDEFIKENGIQVIGQAFRNSYVLFGYGFGEDVPALYILKFMIRQLNPEVLTSLLSDRSENDLLTFPSIVLPEGGQALFECIASTLSDVRLNATVENITRSSTSAGEPIIEIKTSGGNVHVYDRVVITTDLTQSLSFLDAHEDDVRLFNSIQHNLYTSSIVQGVEVPDFPDDRVGSDTITFPANMYRNSSMFPQGLSTKPGSDSPSVKAVMYQYDENPLSIVGISQGPAMTPIVDGPGYQDLVQDAEQFLNTSGIVSDGVVRQFIWPTYFPHFRSEELKAGAYKTLESLQGKQGTYYAGSIFNFETIQDVTTFAIALANTIQ